MTPNKMALQFLKGLKKDIQESGNGRIDIEGTGIEQIDDCIRLLEGKAVTKERLIEIQKEWMDTSVEDGLFSIPLVELHAAWQDPKFNEDCAQYIWERL